MTNMPLMSCDSNKLGANSRKSGKAETNGIEIGTLAVFVCFSPVTHTKTDEYLCHSQINKRCMPLLFGCH